MTTTIRQGPIVGYGRAPEDDEELFFEIPGHLLSAVQRRAVELALLAAEESLPGMPRGVEARYQVPVRAGTLPLYESILERKVPTFPNTKRVQGTFYAAQPQEVWVSVTTAPSETAHSALHECVHAWRHATGVPEDMSREDQEDEANAIATRLLPLVLAAAEAEGGLPA